MGPRLPRDPDRGCAPRSGLLDVGEPERPRLLEITGAQQVQHALSDIAVRIPAHPGQQRTPVRERAVLQDVASTGSASPGPSARGPGASAWRRRSCPAVPESRGDQPRVAGPDFPGQRSRGEHSPGGDAFGAVLGRRFGPESWPATRRRAIATISSVAAGRSEKLSRPTLQRGESAMEFAGRQGGRDGHVGTGGLPDRESARDGVPVRR